MKMETMEVIKLKYSAKILAHCLISLGKKSTEVSKWIKWKNNRIIEIGVITSSFAATIIDSI